MENNSTSLTQRLMGWARNLFWVLLLLNLVPTLIWGLKTKIQGALEPRSYVGCLVIKGMIMDSTTHVKNLHKFLKDPQIKALLLRIDCPGGAAASSQILFHELQRFGAKKPIVALVENLCASGAYYAAAASSCIIATPASFVGSIGGFLQLPNIKELANSLKVKVDFVQSGKYKTVTSMMHDRTEDDLAYLQPLTDNTYEQFFKDIAAARHLAIDKKELWADGRIFTGEQALALGLIDKLGTYSDALDELKARAKITDEIVFVYPAQPSTLERLTGAQADEVESESASVSSTHVAAMIGKACEMFVTHGGLI